MQEAEGRATATNLSVLSKNSTILDCDDQASLADWGDRRELVNPEIIPVPAKRAQATLAKTTTEWNFIDTPGSLDASVLEVMNASDFILVVLKYGQFELDSISTSLSAVKMTEVPAAIVLNMIHPNANAQDLIQSLEDADFGVPVAPIVIRQRADFQNAAIQGLGVTEISKKTKASKEILSLWKWIKGEIDA